jgi:hypothetical protein
MNEDKLAYAKTVVGVPKVHAINTKAYPMDQLVKTMQ